MTISTQGLRPLTLTRHYMSHAEGSCLVELGNTRVIVTASVDEAVPPWMRGNGTGWITAEYGMLPRATTTRNRRPAGGQISGRSIEIQRLIGRSVRAVADLTSLGERTLYVDCDVISADGGTRVASVIGAAMAVHDAGSWLIEKGLVSAHPLRELVAAISVGMVNGTLAVDLCYEQDSAADVDMNVVMTESGKLIEVQGTAEREPYSRADLNDMLDAAEEAIGTIIAYQQEALGL